MDRFARRFVLPWWLVVGGGTVALLAYISPWTKLAYPSLYRFKARYFVLDNEMNFGVWWSSTLFLLAAALFYEISGRERPPRRRAFLQLGLLLLAFSLDEIAALHEWLSGIGGWPMLAPFGLMALLMLVDSLRRLWADRARRPAFWLLLLGFLLLATVPIQEYAEHNLTTRKFSDLYGRYLEEMTELLGAAAILMAAVYGRRGRLAGGLEAVVPDPTRMPFMVPLIGVAFLLHLLTLLTPLIEIGQWDGSPSAFYPYSVYMALSWYAFWVPTHRRGDRRHTPEIRGFWAAVGLLFLACSVGTIQNFWGVFGGYIYALRREVFDQPVPLYVLLILAAWFFGFALGASRNRRPWLLLLLPLTLVIFYRVAPVFQLHLAAGVFALLCTLIFMRPIEPLELAPAAAATDPKDATPG